MRPDWRSALSARCKQERGQEAWKIHQRLSEALPGPGWRSAQIMLITSNFAFGA